MERLVIILTYNVTIQMKSLWHTDFHTVLIISQDFANWLDLKFLGIFLLAAFSTFFSNIFKNFNLLRKPARPLLW